MAAKNYSFLVKNKIPLEQKILAFAVGALLFAGLIYYFIISIDSESLWMPILIFTGGILLIYYIVHRLLRDKTPLQEEIKLTEKAMFSKIYGEINFKEIRFMVEEDLAGEIFFLQIFLQNGMKYTWKHSDYKENSTESMAQFNQFFQAFKQAFEEFKSHSKIDFPLRHQFTFYKESGYFYVLICIAFVPFLLLFDDINDLGFWVFPVIIIPIITGIWLMIKKVVQKEEVELFEDHLVSKKYGRIDFKNIIEIISYEDERRPALILKLNKGENISWKTPTLGTNQTDREVKLMFVEIRHFIADFCEITDWFSKKIKSSEEVSIAFIRPENRENSVDKIARIPLSNSPQRKKPDPKPQVIPHTRKKRNLYIAVPAGIAVSILILSRNCIGNYQKKKSPFYQIEQKTENVQTQAQDLLNDFTKKNGPYYLLTNRDSVEIFYYPTKKTNQEMSWSELVFEQEKRKNSPEILQQTQQSMDFYRNMNYARQYPDSVDWQMLLRNSKTIIPLRKPAIDQTENVEDFVYLAYFIPDVLIERTPAMRAYAKRKNLPETEDKFGSFAIPVDQKSSLTNYFKNEIFAVKNLLYWKEKYPNQIQIYLVAQQKSGISEKQFEVLSSQILQILNLKEEEFTFKKL